MVQAGSPGSRDATGVVGFLGSAPNAGASAAVTHPVKQGLVQTLGVYFDTFLVCSITAFIILVSTPDLANATQGIGLTQNAIVSNLAEWSNVLLSIIIFLLAFSSILGNYDMQQRREGKDPVFTRDRLPEVTGIQSWLDELSVTGPLPVVEPRTRK